MSGKNAKDIGASIRQRLLNLSRASNTTFQDVLEDYARERFLYRLSCSAHKDRFVLKGAMLFRMWSDEPHRATRDLDLLAFGDPAATAMRSLFRDICGAVTEDDGVVFDVGSISVEETREEEEYGGLRVRLTAWLAGARIPLKIDVGFGDAVTPSAAELTYPAMLDMAAPIIQAYPRETVIAEKLHAMTVLGMANSRMKDFYDIHSLATGYPFDGSLLCSAIQATFERRSTVIPAAALIALTSEFSQDSLKASQWRAFVGGGRVRQSSLALGQVVEVLGSFLLPPIVAARQGQRFDETWVPPGPWVSDRRGTTPCEPHR